VFKPRLVWIDAIKRGPPQPIKASVAEPQEAQNGLLIPQAEICRLRLALASGISTVNGAVAEWLKAAVC
jgi:hypothetical protein